MDAGKEIIHMKTEPMAMGAKSPLPLVTTIPTVSTQEKSAEKLGD
jgi:hypothetical protein